MPIIGITGGVATGKTTFRKMLLKRFPVGCFDADAFARELLDGDEIVRRQVLERISPEAYGSDGQPNRPLIREIVYRDAAKRHALEAILHPAIRARWNAEALEARRLGKSFVVDIPLLFETGAESHFDSIVTVACTSETQLIRLRENRSLDRVIAEKMIASQMDIALKIRSSTYVIWNDGPYNALIPQVENLSRCLVNV